MVSDYHGDIEKLDVVLLGDLHIGNKNFAEDAFMRTLDWIDQRRSSTRILIMGDLLESAHKGSVGKAVYDEDMPVREQLDYAVDNLKDFVSLIDGGITGNHEERIPNISSLDPMEIIFQRLAIPEKYAMYQAVVEYKVGDQLYTGFIWHGSAGGSTAGGVLNAMWKMRDQCLANFYVMGHTHRLMDDDTYLTIPDPSTKTFRQMPQVFINSGSYLRKHKGYPEKQGLKGAYMGSPVLELYGEQKKMVVRKDILKYL